MAHILLGKQREVDRIVARSALALAIRKANATGLKGWLDANTASADQTYGAALQDPGLTALFADEAKEIIDTMKKTVDQIAVDAKKAFGP